MKNPPMPRTLEGVDRDWMECALEAGGLCGLPPLERVSVQRMGDEAGALATIGRCRLHFAEDAARLPQSVIIKLSSPSRRNRFICRIFSLYRREYDYYRRLAPLGTMPSPTLHYGSVDPRGSRLVLVLADLAHMQMVDQFTGPDARQAAVAVEELARMHAKFWNRTGEHSIRSAFDTRSRRFRILTQLIYMASLRTAVQRTEHLIAPESRKLIKDYGPRLAVHYREYSAGSTTFTHGDYRIENMFFGAEGADEFRVIDWQASGIGGALYDLAYFLAGSVPVASRPRIEREAVERYHAVLRRSGVYGLTLDECWNRYRQSMLATLMPIVAAWGFLDLENERLIRMVEVGLKRILAAVHELDAEEYLPSRRRSFSRSGGRAAFPKASSCLGKRRPPRPD